MNTVRRKGPILVGGMFLIFAGVGLGAVANSLTSSAVLWQRPSQFAQVQQVAGEPVDQGEAGRAWARVAYDGGLRRCPELNADFLAACQAEIKALAARPDFAPGSYGGPLLVTKVEPMPQANLEVPAAPSFEAEEALPVEPIAFPEPTPENYPAEPTRDQAPTPSTL